MKKCLILSLIIGYFSFVSCQNEKVQEDTANIIAKDTNYIHYEETIRKIQLKLASGDVDINSLASIKAGTFFNPCDYDEKPYKNIRGYKEYFGLHCELQTYVENIKALYGNIFKDEQLMESIGVKYNKINGNDINKFKEEVFKEINNKRN